jgi:hypothetical protein
MTATEFGIPIAKQTVNGLVVGLYHPADGLKAALSRIVVVFRDASTDEPVDVGRVSVELEMKMSDSARHNARLMQLTATRDTGHYHVSLAPEMPGPWNALLRYDGPRGQGALVFELKIEP